ncbi:hypothetical protein AAP_01696 [Ascosphaera apis ARSEF 7405]|uniref:Uncharacterized protein n=1 Tax=Ascosphaera apis ARSEF 7405 TaxID=392613 RepID=A0A168BER9_9EURO|nr:hypothetical protein AAP_01696 [Ascosphaera apis ARSEF 7405]
MKAAALLGLLPAMAAANANIPWSISGAPKDGLTDVSFRFDLHETSHRTGYYFAMQYTFPNASTGYCGLQPRNDTDSGQSILHAVFSSFEDKAEPNDDKNCKSGADGKAGGVSCAIEIPAPYDSNYTVNVHQTAEDTWTGTLIDTTLGNSSQIGSYKLPSNAGKIEDSYIGFIENYGYRRADHKNCASPETYVNFYPPYSSEKGTEGHIDRPTFYGSTKGETPFKTWMHGDGYRVLYGGECYE